MAYSTAAAILNAAAVELGLYTTELADPYDSTDKNVIQLCAHLAAVGRKLRRLHPWSQLQKTHTFSTVASTATYALPTDFGGMAAQTQWDRTGLRELFGPSAAREWSYFKSGASGSSFVLGTAFRIVNDLINLHPVPTGISSLAFEYSSKLWVMPTGQTTPTQSTPTIGTDVLWMDSHLLICALKRDFLRAKGFDVSAAQADYDEALGMALGIDSGAPILSLNGPRGPHLLSWCNAPEGDWGL